MAEKEPASSFCLLGLVHSPDTWAQLQGPFGNRSQHSHQKMTEQRSPTLLPGKERGRVTPEWLSASKGLEPGFEINLSPATFPSHSGRIPPAHTDRSHSRLTGGGPGQSVCLRLGCGVSVLFPLALTQDLVTGCFSPSTANSQE